MKAHTGRLPRTFLIRFLGALVRRDLDSAVTVLAEAGQRQALPRRLVFGPGYDRPCGQGRSSWPRPRSEAA